MSQAVLGPQPQAPEFELRETTRSVALKILVIWTLTLVALGAGAQAILTETAKAPHQVVLGFGGLFLLVVCSPWTYRASLLVAADQGFLYLTTWNTKSSVCLPLTRLLDARVESLRGGNGKFWGLELVLDFQADDADLDQIAGRGEGVVHVGNGGHDKAKLQACAEHLTAQAERAGQRRSELPRLPEVVPAGQRSGPGEDREIGGRVSNKAPAPPAILGA